jgi:cobalt-zinc-cadmium resistance protein CzcA
MMQAFQRLYTPALQWVLRHMSLVFTLAVLLLVGAILLFSRLGAEFIPQLDEGDFAVETRVLTGSSLSKSIEVATQSAAVLKKNFPEVIDVIGKIGSSEIPTDPMPVESCDMIIMLKDKREWTSAGDRDELAEKMQATLEKNIPGVTYGFQQPIQMRFNELIAGARQDVVVKVFGDNLEQLTAYANRIGKVIRSIKGTADVYVEQVTGLPQIVVQYKRDRIAQYGLNIAATNQVIRAGFAGEMAGQVFEGEKRFDLVVRLDTAHRKSIEDLSGLYVTAPGGNQVPLSQLADIATIIGPNQVQREDTRRRIIAGFNVRGRDVGSIVTELQQQINQQVKLQPGYTIRYGGTFENLQEARSRLAIAVPAALLLIFLLLYFTFGSVKQGLLIFTAIPLSAIGGIIALWMRGMPFSISAGVGFIALFGVAVLNGIVLIAAFNRLQKEGMTDKKQIIEEGTRSRLRPVLMTAMVASLGFLPMALSHGSGAEVQRPLATVVIGGLVTATLLTLLVLPALYLYFNTSSIKAGKPATLLVLLLTGGSFFTQAQQPPSFTLPSAIAYAQQHNPSVKAAALDVQSQLALKGTASGIGKTELSMQYGQYNSINRSDNHFTIAQTIPFPTVFARKADLNNALVKNKEYQLQLTQSELAYAVTKAWHQLLYTYAQAKLLEEQDTIFAGFARSAALRFKTGETNLLEKTTVETQRNEITNKLQQNKADQEIAASQLQALLQCPGVPVIADTALLYTEPPVEADTALIHQHPLLSQLKQETIIAEQNKKLAAAERLPDITLGYFNQSLIGLQNVDGQEKYFDGSKRFQGFQLGIGIPLWGKPYTARIRAEELQRQRAQENYDASAVQLQLQYNQAVQEFRKHRASLAYYRQSALTNAALMIRHSRIAFDKGETGFSAYLLALSNAITVKEHYLETLLQYQLSIAMLTYLQTGK